LGKEVVYKGSNKEIIAIYSPTLQIFRNDMTKMLVFTARQQKTTLASSV